MRSHSASLLFTTEGSLLLSPITRKRTLLAMNISSSSESRISAMSAAISSLGRFQFSVEKVYSVKYSTPRRTASSVIRLTVSTPSLCPALLGRPRFVAQRPLPSIIMAMWRGILCMFSSVSFIILCCAFGAVSVFVAFHAFGRELVSYVQQRGTVMVFVLESGA